MSHKKGKRKNSIGHFRAAIHDELGPQLFSVATKLTLLKDQLEGKRRREAAVILQEVESTRLQVWRMARGLEEEAVEDLEAGLKRVAKEVKGTYQGCLRERIRDPEMIDSLYRIGREAAHNAMRHGAARRISIRLGEGLLTIEDDGRGVVEGWREGMGLKLMKRRARRWGGRVTLQSVAPHRTILSCHFPWRAE